MLLKVEDNILGRKPLFDDTCSQGKETWVTDGIAELALKKG